MIPPVSASSLDGFALDLGHLGPTGSGVLGRTQTVWVACTHSPHWEVSPTPPPDLHRGVSCPGPCLTLLIIVVLSSFQVPMVFQAPRVPQVSTLLLIIDVISGAKKGVPKGKANII